MIQDFAENRKALYNLEVKLAHFGKAQMTLHPTVAYFKDGDGQLVCHVIMHMTLDMTTMLSMSLQQKYWPY